MGATSTLCDMFRRQHQPTENLLLFFGFAVNVAIVPNLTVQRSHGPSLLNLGVVRGSRAHAFRARKVDVASNWNPAGPKRTAPDALLARSAPVVRASSQNANGGDDLSLKGDRYRR